MHVIHIIVFRDFTLMRDLSLLFLRMCLHAVYLDEPPEFCTQNTVKTFISNCKHSLHNSQPGKRQKKGAENTKNFLKPFKKQPRITEMPIHMGLILSNDLCVW